MFRRWDMVAPYVVGVNGVAFNKKPTLHAAYEAYVKAYERPGFVKLRCKFWCCLVAPRVIASMIPFALGTLCNAERCKFWCCILSCLDGYMNIAMEQTEEHVNGAIVNRYGDAFIRGNNDPNPIQNLIFSHSQTLDALVSAWGLGWPLGSLDSLSTALGGTLEDLPRPATTMVPSLASYPTNKGGWKFRTRLEVSDQRTAVRASTPNPLTRTVLTDLSSSPAAYRPHTIHAVHPSIHPWRPTSTVRLVDSLRGAS
ncbi:hypothetical protein NMY22_g12899 [Coprinellus aureogranulatus]|nr:hypothetical protein NMY22_g12899 [Coprinellus aureogranulatus]